MAVPTTRNEFKEYCLRKNGKGINDINVTDEQVEDRIDEALDYFRDWHWDGTGHVLLGHQITASDKSNRYITLDDEIQGVVGIAEFNASGTSSSLFNIEYQIRLHDLFDFSSTQFVPYWSIKTHLETLRELFNGTPQFRYNRHQNILYIDHDWDSLTEGSYILIECYRTTTASTYSNVWGDPWLRNYATALIKRQWGENLGKFAGMQLPGGQTVNADRIINEADGAIEKLEEQVKTAIFYHDLTG